MLTVIAATVTVVSVTTTAPPEHLSVDELAERSGVTRRAIRWYQSEGLLPAPTRVGRSARYSASHVERLRLIATLQQRGLRLSAVADLLGSAPDEAVAEWLGLDETVRRPWTSDEPALLGTTELAERLADTPAGTLDALVAAGLVERRGDTSPVVHLVPSPGLLEVTVALVRLGLDVETAARLHALLQSRLRVTAEDLVTAFTEEVSLARLATDGPGALARLLEDLRPLTRRTVHLLFAHEMERASRQLLDAEPPERNA